MARLNNRKPSELRPTTIKAGVIEQADGSAMVTMGRTTAIAAIYGPATLHPRRLQVPGKAFLRTVYSMAPFST
ncbi:exosome complex exonuclease Rrp41, partial [Candidatus Aenigmatarchaeota archaeon]